MLKLRICFWSTFSFLLVFVPMSFSDERCEAEDSLQIAFQKGVVAFAKKHYDEAIADFTEAIRVDPTNPKAFCARSLPFLYGPVREGAARFYRAIRLDPTYYRAILNRGALLYRLDRTVEAINDLESVIRFGAPIFSA